MVGSEFQCAWLCGGSSEAAERSLCEPVRGVRLLCGGWTDSRLPVMSFHGHEPAVLGTYWLRALLDPLM